MAQSHVLALIALTLGLSGCASTSGGYAENGTVYRDGSYYSPAGDGRGDYYYAPEPSRFDDGYGVYGFGFDPFFGAIGLSGFDGYCSVQYRNCAAYDFGSFYQPFGYSGFSLFFGNPGWPFYQHRYDRYYGQGPGYGYRGSFNGHDRPWPTRPPHRPQPPYATPPIAPMPPVATQPDPGAGQRRRVPRPDPYEDFNRPVRLGESLPDQPSQRPNNPPRSDQPPPRRIQPIREHWPEQPAQQRTPQPMPSWSPAPAPSTAPASGSPEPESPRRGRNNGRGRDG